MNVYNNRAPLPPEAAFAQPLFVTWNVMPFDVDLTCRAMPDLEKRS
ncbi:hypothetical protein Bphyt_2422 [Paraburkholderia phytofirmans PsJN]|uniref:Uncharacterized protein n=1 Tax=Paraburkholderia phytofirmans (strain DSM 17436 / LMG 22146 / PsJN) TaxID=398527 RepID=B2T5G1_PARPJ|nr:hypothetical protein Bphyt_2422 [Paraburkholderia phytofirmans PsJN]